MATRVKPLFGHWDLSTDKVYEAEIVDSSTVHIFSDDVGDERWLNAEDFDVVSDAPAKDTQVGGNHYAKLAIQPYDYCTANKLGYIEGNVIKYVTRWRDKNGVEDLKKAVHSLQWLIEHEEKKNER